ncbi:DEAD/DEAH box helicase family protein [Rhodococcus qingshengii]|uniref:DEAD/DEAH box helicase family protein n=1 Tax=Rhodococcus qingshengii TaxID=334542 RepID=A0AAW6LQU0_RHOSG|nr:DEAD/DEAH box helicase family protein [Rhodococcus qingshengii]MDE8647562.1 DEAD/DEAH box helicase family protein [Rhodococcus qingshengii]
MPTAAPRFQLHPHQQQSLRQLTEAWDQGYARVTLSLPCGTGKTVVMAGLLENLTAPSHRTVVFVPTVRLLVQTANILRAARPGARLIAVCNDRGATTDEFTPATAEERECEIDIEPADAAAELDTDITTDPERIAELLTQGGNNALVVATYASSAVVAAATELASITWDLLICDEAHRTAGTADKAWALPLDNNALPSRRRLFATATIRAVEPATDTDPELGPIEVLSMTSVADYGPTIAPLSLRDAITDRRLSDYRIATIAVTEQAALELLEKEADTNHLDPQAAAAQLALMRAADTNPDLRSVMVFHNRIDTSRTWATQFRALAKTTDKNVQVFHVDGGSDPRHVTAALNALAAPGDDLVVVSNCRLLSEGVDVPALDAVMFAAPRTGAPDIVQIVGRALRPHPDGHHRTALIILPVLHRPHDTTSTEDRVARTDYLTAWQVLTVLAEEDEMIFTSLADHRRAIECATPPPGPESRIRFDTTGLPANIDDGFILKTVRRTTSGWLRVHHALQQQAMRGNSLNPRPTLTIPDPHNPNGYPLGQRVAALRKAKAAGRVPTRIITLFDNDPLLTGWSWDARTATATRLSTDDKLDLVEKYITATRIPHVLPSATVDDTSSGKRVKIGAWLATLKLGTLTPQQRQRLHTLLPTQFGGWN